MKNEYILENLDCANCAAKMEEGIKKISGIKNCNISFITRKMVIETVGDDTDRVIKEAKKIIKKLEPDVSVVKRR